MEQENEQVLFREQGKEEEQFRGSMTAVETPNVGFMAYEWARIQWLSKS